MENSHAVVEEPLDSDKTGVWVAISRRSITGPIFLLTQLTLSANFVPIHQPVK
jgi:hypothetical protein